jgi:hypothetical protein
MCSHTTAPVDAVTEPTPTRSELAVHGITDQTRPGAAHGKHSNEDERHRFTRRIPNHRRDGVRRESIVAEHTDAEHAGALARTGTDAAASSGTRAVCSVYADLDGNNRG